MTFEHGYVAVRDLDASGDPERDAGPALPGSWGVSRQGTTGWWMLTHPSGDVLAAFRVNSAAGVGLWAIFGPRARLDEFAAERPDVMPGRELWRRRAETTVEPGASYSPRQMIRGWRSWRCDVVEDVDGVPTPLAGVKRVLVDEGALIPGTLVDGAPAVLGSRTVTALHRPALHITLAGAALHVVLEDEPDPGA